MEVIRAKSAGFCFGVKRAVDTVYEQVEKQMGKQIYTYGPIIHNEEVVKDMEAHGVKVLHSEEELKGLEEGLVIIRSHGVPKRICDLMDEKGIEYVDATCPFVKRIHKIVAEESKKGSRIIIIGNPDHPEVEGIRGWAGENVTVIKNAEEAEKFENTTSERICIVSQTTFNYNKFKDLVEIISEKGYDINVFNTICNATEERQTEARELAKKSDAMIVIGGRHSSNTQKLFEISKKECSNTFYIQTKNDLNMEDFSNIGMLGITAGASTPNNIIKEVHESMAEMSFDQMLEESFKTIRNGEVVQGTIIDVKEDEIILNIGYKADGIISRNEYSNDQNLDLTTVAKVGDEMEAKVLKVNDGEGQVLLTYKRLKAEKGNKRLEEAFNNHEVLKAPVAKVLDGGLSVVVEETRVFIPASLVSDTYEKNLKKYDGQEIEFVITEFNPRKRRIIGDRKQLLVAEKKAKQEALFAKIEAGMTVEGTVKNVTDFGAFIELAPGVDALLHVSQISKDHVEKPSDVLKIGQEIEAKVVEFNEDDKKISLSVKALLDSEDDGADVADVNIDEVASDNE